MRRKKYAILFSTPRLKFIPITMQKLLLTFSADFIALRNIVIDIEAGRISVLINDGKIIGTGSHTDNHITRVYVLPEFQGQGYGSRIMDELEKEIFSKYDYCELDASLPACIFYENRGFKTVKHIKYDIGNGAFLIYEIMRKNKDQ